MKISNILASISSIAISGIPSELQDGIIQIAVGFVVYFLTRLFDRVKVKK